MRRVKGTSEGEKNYREGQIAHDVPYMVESKKMHMNFFTKQTDLQTENKRRVTSGKEGGMYVEFGINR